MVCLFLGDDWYVVYADVDFVVVFSNLHLIAGLFDGLIHFGALLFFLDGFQDALDV